MQNYLSIQGKLREKDYKGKKLRKNMENLASGRNIISFMKRGVVEQPEKFEEAVQNYIDSLKEFFPKMSLIAVSKMGIKNLARLCHIIDTERTLKPLRNLEDRPGLREYFINPDLYGPATKALSKHLGLEGEAMYVKIFYSEKLN